ncbi:PREDICTED: zinc-finger homeodomain protein 8-like [Erythranthe guttata]|uniref:zinc-finger homeodomain protein 8-like n=1 Tax=Erythranthe guttata TaxID=4155 RepID=UPI00064D791B|nr:PREDICTED: zinc-finger homeodomain protein 8-like [Erythranthe guttata]|eukprot:XP_012851797.1 PREDICTED: zinc-finger homeodomain protein 8-like [Erythranthe guttata]
MTSVIEQRNQNNMEAVKYAECRKSHIHYLGWADGCQEYKESTSSPSKCEICGCHRNFHRKLEVAAAAEELLVRHEKEVGLQCGATAGQGSTISISPSSGFPISPVRSHGSPERRRNGRNGRSGTGTEPFLPESLTRTGNAEKSVGWARWSHGTAPMRPERHRKDAGTRK